MSVLKHAFIFSATIAYKQNKIRLADEERERKRRLEIEEALKKAEERKDPKKMMAHHQRRQHRQQSLFLHQGQRHKHHQKYQLQERGVQLSHSNKWTYISHMHSTEMDHIDKQRPQQHPGEEKGVQDGPRKIESADP